MKLPDYSTYGFRELYEALDRLRGDLYPQILKTLEAEIDNRKEVEKPLLEEVYFRLDRKRFSDHARRLRERIESLGGFESIAPETVTDENRFKTGWRRFWALFFDVIIVTLVMLPLTAVALNGREDDLAFRGAVEYIQQIASLFYYIVMHAAFGQTLGKMITGVRVVKNKDLAPIGLGHALARDIVPLLFIAVGLLAMPMFDFGIAEGKEATLKLPIIFLAIAVLALAWPILEVITMLFNRRRRAIHDFIAGTVVIRYLRSADKPAKDKLSTASTAAT